VDVLLGFDSLEDYRRQDKYLGAIVGRYANRIGGASFTIDAATYPVAANDGGKNHLHGGVTGFDKQIWTVMGAGEKSLTLALESPHGQEGYPGNLTVQVTYTLSEDALTIDYAASADRPTLCNLTNHAYFNLSGHQSGPVTDQLIRLFADAYTPADPSSIPTGEILPVAGTPMDLREPTAIGAHIDEDFPQLTQAGGYDHNWVINGPSGVLRPAAWAHSPATGITLEALTTQPGVQFYTGNYLDGCPAGKNDAVYGRRHGFCLEAQLFPDSPHHPNFPSATLRPGETWRASTVYRFSVE
jgi:aldose 1-epimerase